MLRRPEKGLLARQWEFPSLEIEEEENNCGDDHNAKSDEHSANSRYRMNTYLRERCAISWTTDITKITDISTSNGTSSILTTVTSLSYVSLPDPIVHIFSHERHTMSIHLEDVQISDPSLISANNAANEVRWMTAEEMIEAGITTGCKKILKAVQATSNSTTSNKNRKRSSAKMKDSTDNIEIQEDIEDIEEITSTGAKDVFAMMKSASRKLKSTENRTKKVKKTS
jgi:hypothetical protein